MYACVCVSACHIELLNSKEAGEMTYSIPPQWIILYSYPDNTFLLRSLYHNLAEVYVYAHHKMHNKEMIHGHNTIIHKY